MAGIQRSFNRRYIKFLASAVALAVWPSSRNVFTVRIIRDPDSVSHLDIRRVVQGNNLGVHKTVAYITKLYCVSVKMECRSNDSAMYTELEAVWGALDGKLECLGEGTKDVG